MRYTIHVTQTAEQDLKSIVDYITTKLQEREAAKRQLRHIQEKIFSLSTMPERYPLVKDPGLAHKGYRMLPVDNYLVMYRINKKDNVILISRIIYAKREWKQLL